MSLRTSEAGSKKISERDLSVTKSLRLHRLKLPNPKGGKKPVPWRDLLFPQTIIVYIFPDDLHELRPELCKLSIADTVNF